MTDCTAWEALLSAYLDDDLEDGERSRVDAHLRACAACRLVLADFETIRTAAGSLQPLVPPARVWHRLADSPVRRSAGSWVTWRPAAAVAMTAVLAVGLWRVATLLEPAALPSATREAPAYIGGADPEAAYVLAIARLEEAVALDGGALDPDTAVAIDAGLMVINEAIVESRSALRSEPDSDLAQDVLVQALGRKVALLQDRLALMTDRRTAGDVALSPLETNR